MSAVSADEFLTPRTRRLQWLAQVLQVAALVNAALLLLVILTQALGAGIAPGLASGLGDSAVLIVCVGLVANAGVCLLLAVGVLAQENWSWLLLIGTGVANGLALLTWGYWLALVTLIALAVTVWGMMQDRAAYHNNPVTVKELRGRMRGVRAFAIISVFLLMLGMFTVVLYILALSQITGTSVVETGQLGRTLFRGVVGVELVLIVLIVPALTAGAVSGERERHTFDLLSTTLLPVPTFLTGKIASALGYIALLVLSAVPMQSIAFLFGGVSQTEVVLSVAVLMATALLLGAMGLFFSATTERTLQATIRVYVAAILVVVGLPLVSGILFGGAFGYAIVGVGAVNMSAAQETTLIYADMLMSGLNPVTSALYTQQILVDHQSSLLFSVRLASNGALLPVIAPWAILIVGYVLMAAVLLRVAIWRMTRAEA